jgi:hypothetical protein
MKIFELVNPDARFPKNKWFQLDQDGHAFLPDPMDVPSKKLAGKKLWEERLIECRKTNPKCTFEDMCWGLADIPDSYLVESTWDEDDDGNPVIVSWARDRFKEVDNRVDNKN